MSNVEAFKNLAASNASAVTYHRESGGVDCPCLTEEGYRSRRWHIEHPPGTPNADLNFAPWNGINPPLCNEEGKQNQVVIDVQIRGWVHPVQSGATRRLTSDYMLALFGEVQVDDHLGIFPLDYGGITLEFRDWGQTGEDYLIYDGRRYQVVNANKIPDPADGEQHHWETGLRLVKTERPV